MTEEQKRKAADAAEAEHIMKEIHRRDLRIAELEVLGEHLLDALMVFERSLIGTGRAKDRDATLAVIKARFALEAALRRESKKEGDA